MKSKWIIWAGVAIAVVVVAFLLLKPAGGGGEGEGKGLVNVGGTELQTVLDEGGVKVVDVRTPGEFQAGHIEGAENVPVDQVASTAASWDRAQPLAVYCATGSRSTSAVQELQSMGFETIYHLSDGLVAWQGALDTGGSQQTAQSEPVKTSGTPVMYEFFTDW